MIDILVTFELSAQAGANGYQAAYQALANLGFRSVAQGVRLPTTTVVGTWWPDDDLEQARNTIWSALHAAGASPTHLIVVYYVRCAWIGPRVTF